MPQTPFHAYYKARLLEQLPEEEQFIPVFASSDIEIYPFQIAAASFALRSPYQKGAVLCDEAGMGKSHEAMLVINQKWLEGCSRILLVIPNADLLHQWTEMLERFYTVPYVVLTSRKEWQTHSTPTILTLLSKMPLLLPPTTLPPTTRRPQRWSAGT